MSFKELLEAIGVNTSLEDIARDTGIDFSVGGIFQALLGLVFFIVIVRVAIGMVKKGQARSKGEARPLGEPVPATAGTPCDLCGRPLSARAHRVAELDLCKRCIAGDFGRHLDKRGFCIQELSWKTHRVHGNRHGGGARGFARSFSLPTGPPVSATFINRETEGSLTRANELKLPPELEQEDPRFCSRVYMVGESSEVLSALLDHPGLRVAIREYLDFGAGGFVLDGPRIYQKEGFWGSDEQPARARCLGAVLLHHLEHALSQVSPGGRTEHSHAPDLTQLFDNNAGRSEVQDLEIRHAVVDDFRDVLQLATAQESGLPLELVKLTHVKVTDAARASLDEVRARVQVESEDVEGL